MDVSFKPYRLGFRVNSGISLSGVVIDLVNALDAKQYDTSNRKFASGIEDFDFPTPKLIATKQDVRVKVLPFAASVSIEGEDKKNVELVFKDVLDSLSGHYDLTATIAFCELLVHAQVQTGQSVSAALTAFVKKLPDIDEISVYGLEFRNKDNADDSTNQVIIGVSPDPARPENSYKINFTVRRKTAEQILADSSQIENNLNKIISTINLR